MKIPASSRLASVAEMQQAERVADAAGHSYATMMELAGAATAAEVMARYAQGSNGQSADAQEIDGQGFERQGFERQGFERQGFERQGFERQGMGDDAPRVLVLVGPGNNGGDGLVCARHLDDAGARVRVYLWRRRTGYGEDYQGHFAKLVAHRVPAARADDDLHFSRLREWLADCDVIVDALLGTGSNRQVQGDLAAILDEVRAVRTGEGAPALVAVDSPSGLNCDTGEIDPHSPAADVTVTFGYAKLGHYKFPGAAACGEIVVAPIGLSAGQGDLLRTFVLDEEIVRQWLPERSANSHKGSFGKAMVCAGSVNYPGAAMLATSAAGRAGAGLVTGAVPDAIWGVVAQHVTEPTWLPLPSSGGSLDGAGAPQLREQTAGYTALLLGCGLTQNAPTQRFVQALLTSQASSAGQASDRVLPPTVIDADGLNALAKIPNFHRLLPEKTVLTPHAAEFGRLLNVETSEIVALRWELALEAASLWNVVVLAKGPYTVIASPQGDLAVLPVATPALATAGTGDVLAGTIVALLAQGVEPFGAACLGAWLHGAAGLRCAEEIGVAGVVAGDLLPRLPGVIALLRRS